MNEKSLCAMKPPLAQAIAALVVFLTGLLFSKPAVFTDDLADLKATARKGDAPAQTILGSIYSSGRGVDRDEKEGLKWARLAADQGYAPAQWLVGDIYGEGIGVDKDEKERVKWYRKAADQGLAVTQYNLGVCYLAGQGVDKDEAEAVRWFRKAAAQDNAIAQNDLGMCLFNGWGVVKDEAEGIQWTRKAAKNGSEQAQLNLAIFYFKGQGVGRDLVSAHAWATLAENGEGKVTDQARGLRSQLEATMSDAQIAESATLVPKLMMPDDSAPESANSPAKESLGPPPAKGSEEAAKSALENTPPTGKIVKVVEIEVSRASVDTSTIRGKMKMREGGPFSDAMIESDLKSIYSTGLVEDIDIKTEDVAGGVKVIVMVTGRGTIGAISFEGNSAINKEELSKIVEVKVGQPAHESEIAGGVIKMLDKYAEKGFADVDVTYEIQPLPDKKDFVHVTYLITEGQTLMIHEIRYDKLTALSAPQLRSKMELKEKEKLSEEALQSDIRTIEHIIQDLGCVYAKVLQVRREPVKDDQVDLVFEIEEGGRYNVTDMALEGNKAFTKKELTAAMFPITGKPYSRKDVSDNERMIADYYGSRGYADARVETSVEEDGKNSVKIDYHIVEGEKSLVGRINIAGNVYITKDIILRELKIAPGDVFNTVLIDKARKTLLGKGYFLDLDFRSVPTGEPGLRDLDIQVQER